MADDITEEWGEVAATRLIAPPLIAATEQAAIASYGPFRVMDATTTALVGITDADSPAQFSAMLRDHPGLATLRFVECPGTDDDGANLALGRLICAAAVAAHVPAGGSVRSGAVELLVAAVQRVIDDGAEFAVHAWLDDHGLQATDYDSGSPQTVKYLAYYQEMGVPDAHGFYAMTNSVPFDDARWLTGAEMRGWLAGTSEPAPQLAYLDLASRLP